MIKTFSLKHVTFENKNTIIQRNILLVSGTSAPDLLKYMFILCP